MLTLDAGQKRLLALDGGGLLGLVSLGILQRMEDQLREAHDAGPEFRLRDFFDYIAGTSTGAIIAAGLMTGRSVAEIRAIYVKDGPKMFERVGRLRRLWSLFAHKYPRRRVAEVLRREFSDRTILELQETGVLPRDRHLMVVLHNVTTDSCWPVTTNPDAKYNDPKHPDCNLRLPLWQLVRASTAAPSFFPPEEVDLGERRFVFQDGGVTAHNNPALKLFQMATDAHYRLRRERGGSEVGWPVGEDRLMLVSVGTGYQAEGMASMRPGGIPIWRLASYAPPVLMRSMSVENDVACRVIGRCRHGPPIDREVGRMIPQGPTDRAFLYARYDVDMSPEGLTELGATVRHRRWEMDDPTAIEDYAAIGEAAAEQVDMRGHFGAFMPAATESAS